MIHISKDAWKDVLCVLEKYKIPYTVSYERRDVQKAMECQDIVVTDKHIQINLVIPDYFEDNK